MIQIVRLASNTNDGHAGHPLGVRLETCRPHEARFHLDGPARVREEARPREGGVRGLREIDGVTPVVYMFCAVPGFSECVSDCVWDGVIPGVSERRSFKLH